MTKILDFPAPPDSEDEPDEDELCELCNETPAYCECKHEERG